MLSHKVYNSIGKEIFIGVTLYSFSFNLFIFSYICIQATWGCIGFDSVDCCGYKHAVRWVISTLI